ncbi:hypothetical protein BG015_011205 [Linnemannia schmuckeri]|uniref:Uncharacterized protein n=1 Tax=Linnemannia schmuckeri TaxID=64567 RepID=A0A9P5RV35_9FUNG|nr:hypothetical protein BG015_011205 [Linnemannia schmuckeri]
MWFELSTCTTQRLVSVLGIFRPLKGFYCSDKAKFWRMALAQARAAIMQMVIDKALNQLSMKEQWRLGVVRPVLVVAMEHLEKQNLHMKYLKELK